jgi:hypothetical protein
MNCSNHQNTDQKKKKKKKEEEEEKRVVVLLGGQHTKGKRIISISFAHLLTITDSSESFFHCLLSSQLVIESGCGGLGPKNSSIILDPSLKVVQQPYFELQVNFFLLFIFIFFI